MFVPGIGWFVPELLHIHMHQRPGVEVLVPADRLARGPIGVQQPVQTRGREDTVDRRRGDAEADGKLYRPLPQPHSQAHTPLRDRFRSLARRRSWARGPVMHGLTGKVSVDPPLHGRPGDLESGGDLANGMAIVNDELGNFEAVAGREGSVSYCGSWGLRNGTKGANAVADPLHR